MKLLLDTHILLWIISVSNRLPDSTRLLLADPQNQLFFSDVSLWEIAIKNGLGRANFQVNPRMLRRELLIHGYKELTITSEHVVSIDSLPSVHKDPFDRLLLTQAMVEGITLLTNDAVLSKYPGPIQLI